MAELLRVASVLRPHGVKGDIKVYPLTDDLSRFKHLKSAYVERDAKYEAVTISGSKSLQGCVVLHIDGYDTPEAAEKLRGTYICVDRQNAVKLPADCYFISDLIGCEVATDNGRQLGVIVDVFETPANDVYAIEGEKRLLVPALKKLLRLVDIEHKRIVFDSVVLEEVGIFED